MRRVCFTLNNYTEEDANKLRTWDAASFMVMGREVGESATPHLQGYVEFNVPQRLTALKKFDGRAHWEAAKGNAEQNVAYCTKTDKEAFTKGERKQQGKRNDLAEVRELAASGGMRAVTLMGNMQQIRVAEKFLQYHEEARNWVPEVSWFWGPTGTGKSRQARAEASDDLMVKNDDSKWWSKYDGQADVIIDDFRGSWWPLTRMLALLDRYSCEVEFKGGCREFRPRRIWVTSAYSPEQCYTGTGEAVNQLLRRINKITYFPASATEVSVTEVGGVILDPPILEYSQDSFDWDCEDSLSEYGNIYGEDPMDNIPE